MPRGNSYVNHVDSHYCDEKYDTDPEYDSDNDSQEYDEEDNESIDPYIDHEPVYHPTGYVATGNHADYIRESSYTEADEVDDIWRVTPGEYWRRVSILDTSFRVSRDGIVCIIPDERDRYPIECDIDDPVHICHNTSPYSPHIRGLYIRGHFVPTYMFVWFAWRGRVPKGYTVTHKDYIKATCKGFEEYSNHIDDLHLVREYKCPVTSDARVMSDQA